MEADSWDDTGSLQSKDNSIELTKAKCNTSPE